MALSAFVIECQDEDNLREGLKFARDVLGELRSSQLNPQKYYELYMNVFDQLIHLRVSPFVPGPKIFRSGVCRRTSQKSKRRVEDSKNCTS